MDPEDQLDPQEKGVKRANQVLLEDQDLQVQGDHEAQVEREDLQDPLALPDNQERLDLQVVQVQEENVDNEANLALMVSSPLN